MRVQLLFAFLLIIFSFSAYLTIKNSFILYSETTGKNLSASFTAQVETEIDRYQEILENYAKELESIVSTAKSNIDISQSLSLFTRLNHRKLFTPYIFFDYKIFGRDRIISALDIDYKNRDWYQKARAADGEIIYSTLYTDYTTQKPVITIAKELKNINAIIAVDIFPSTFEPLILNALPAGSSYMLIDSSANVLFNSQKNVKKDDCTKQIPAAVLEKIQTDLNTDNVISLKNCDSCFISYNILPNHWISVLKIDTTLLLADLTNIFSLFGFILIFFMLFSIYTFIKEYHLFADFDKLTASLNALSNRYCGIYKVNCNTNTYEILKCSDDVKPHFPVQGNYQDFIKMVSDNYIEESAINDFKICFSAENIKRLIDNRIYDYGGDFKRIYEDGMRWVSIRCLIDPDSTNNEAVLCFLSIDQQKMLELKNNELLKNALDFAKQSQRAKNNFFSGISHDMRTPLNAIIGLCELAEKYTGDINEMKTYLKNIRVSSTQLLHLVNDILNLSQIEQNKIALNAKTFNLKQCINDTVSVYYSRAQSEKKTLHVSFQIYNETVLSDDFRITQIINNLISNALKYTQSGNSISLEVKQLNINAANEMAQYEFIVEDNGIGMSEDFLKRIFDPYSRETRFSSSKIEGTGLGMSIVQNIVRQFNGTIDIQSKLHEGTRISVTLPLMTIQSCTEEKEQDQSVILQNLHGKRILVAEDNAINMQIITTILEKNHLETVQAENGKIAYDKYLAHEDGYFDAILMDMQMPVMDGCAAASAIRQENRNDSKTIPIIAVTANAFSEELSQITQSGMNGYLLKPLDMALLWQTLNKFINQAPK